MGLKKSIFGAAAIAALVLLGLQPARAQAVVAFVNGDPITSYDVDQRVRIMNSLARQPISRPQALEQLIDDRLKVVEARRVGYRIKEENLDDRVASIASANRRTVPEFLAGLSQMGIDTAAYRFKLRADLSWDLALGQRFKQSEAASSAEAREAFEQKVRSGATRVTDFVVHTVIFVVPAGTPPGQRERDAAAARSAFQSCETGLDDLRKLRDVAIRSPIKRSSDQIGAPLAKLLNDTPVGRLSMPVRTPQGIEMYAVCEKSERVDETSARAQVEQEISARRRSAGAAEYLKSLRSKAVIQYNR